MLNLQSFIIMQNEDVEMFRSMHELPADVFAEIAAPLKFNEVSNLLSVSKSFQWLTTSSDFFRVWNVDKSIKLQDYNIRAMHIMADVILKD